MSEKVRKLKEDAARLIARARLAEACACYEQIVKSEPRDLTARQKLAELYGRLGRKPEAVRTYQSVAGSYAADGLLLKAIAVCKIILQLDPSHKETLEVLASLSTRRRGADLAPAEPAVVEMPRAMSAALPQGAPARRSAASIRGTAAHHIPPKPGGLDVAVRAGSPSSSTPAHAQAPASPLGHQPHTSLEELQRAAASLLPQAPPAPAGDDIAIDVAVEDPPLVVGAPVAAEVPSPRGAPVLIAAIAAATPSFDELMEMTADIGASFGPLAAGPVAPTSDEASFAALSEEVGARIDLGDAAALPLAGVRPVPPPIPDLIVEDGGGDDGEIVDLTDAEIEAARVDVTQIAPIPLFSDLPREAFLALTERMSLRVASSGEVLIAEDELGTSMFVIIQGRVKVTRRDTTAEPPRDLELAELSDGAFFGEMALLSDAPRTASVVCAEETMVFEISRDLVAQITAEHPSVGEVMRRFHKNRLIANLLKTSVIFAPFSTEEKKTLIERFKSRHVEEGTYLITREKPGDGLYVVLQGRCEVLDGDADGRDVVLAELRDGDVFGEMSMLWNKDTCASVRASTACVVLRLPRSSFSEVIMTHPQILESLATLSERRQRSNSERTQGVAGR
jgi:CRP-like cAMP-binding protein